jgi:hypothetical protein
MHLYPEYCMHASYGRTAGKCAVLSVHDSDMSVQTAGISQSRGVHVTAANRCLLQLAKVQFTSADTATHCSGQALLTLQGADLLSHAGFLPHI